MTRFVSNTVPSLSDVRRAACPLRVRDGNFGLPGCGQPQMGKSARPPVDLLWRHSLLPLGSLEHVEIDVLGPPYERHTIDLGNDDEGAVIATLVRRRASRPTTRAVLYVHGFVDYFFQTHLADFFAELGWDFYALDLRKYGRSLLAHQTPNFARSLLDYFPELDAAGQIIRDEDGHDQMLVCGHSTGGLITSLWSHSRRNRGWIDGLFLNSPFFDFNASWLMRRPVAA